MLPQRISVQAAVLRAHARGAEAGRRAALTHPHPDDALAPAWLSGEWAGESVRELVGDLIDVVASRYALDGLAQDGADAEAWAAICEAYEQGADTAFVAVCAARAGA
jgi:hypothetical protein